MLIHFNRRLCAGHARCQEHGPNVFHLDAMGYCKLLSAKVEPGLEDEARAGAANCPEGALTIVEE